MSRLGVLAEGEELSSNPLFLIFQRLKNTLLLVDIAWRIVAPLWRSLSAPAAGGPVRGLQHGPRGRGGSLRLLAAVSEDDASARHEVFDVLDTRTWPGNAGPNVHAMPEIW